MERLMDGLSNPSGEPNGCDEQSGEHTLNNMMMACDRMEDQKESST